MPNVIIEVLSLNVELEGEEAPPKFPAPVAVKPHYDNWSVIIEEQAQTAPRKLEVHSICGELWPSWDSRNHFMTPQAPPDQTGCVCFGEDTCKESQQAEQRNEHEDPLMAILVSLSPPGGIVRLARQSLSVRLWLAQKNHPAMMEAGTLELQLSPLITSSEGQVVTLSSGTKLFHNDWGTSWGKVDARIAWMTAPAELAKAFGERQYVNVERGLRSTMTRPVWNDNFCAPNTFRSPSPSRHFGSSKSPLPASRPTSPLRSSTRRSKIPYSNSSPRGRRLGPGTKQTRRDWNLQSCEIDTVVQAASKDLGRPYMELV